MTRQTNTALEDALARVDDECSQEAIPTALLIDAGYHARTLVMQGYSERAAWARAQRDLED